MHVTGDPGHVQDYRCLTTCQKQLRQNEPDGQVDIPTWVEVCVMWEPGHLQGRKTFHRLSKTIQSGRCFYQGGGLCDGGSQTCVGTTDVSPTVKNKADRMNQLVR